MRPVGRLYRETFRALTEIRIEVRSRKAGLLPISPVRLLPLTDSHRHPIFIHADPVHHSGRPTRDNEALDDLLPFHSGVVEVEPLARVEKIPHGESRRSLRADGRRADCGLIGDRERNRSATTVERGPLSGAQKKRLMAFLQNL